MYLIIFFTILVFLITYIYGNARGAPWVPSRKHDVQRFLTLANITPGQKVYDIGCGDGRLVAAAAEAGAHAVGYEISLLPFLLAKVRGLFIKNKKNYKILYKDFWHCNLGDADVIYFFLLPKIYNRLQKKLEEELRSGTKVIAYVWPISEWEPEKIDKANNFPTYYMYKR